jgi:signal transduction histidine kinase/ActR/RegA family two-component response regulator
MSGTISRIGRNDREASAFDSRDPASRTTGAGFSPSKSHRSPVNLFPGPRSVPRRNGKNPRFPSPCDPDRTTFSRVVLRRLAKSPRYQTGSGVEEGDLPNVARILRSKSFDRSLQSAMTDDEALQSALDRAVAGMLRPVSLALGLYYAVMAVAHAVVAPEAVAGPMTVAAAATAVVLLALFRALSRRFVAESRAHGLLAGIAFLALGNILLHLYLTSDPLQSTNLMLLVIGVGFFFLSSKWLTFILASCAAGWVMICWGALPAPGWTHFGFGLLTASVLSILAFVVRLRSLQRIEGLRLQNESQHRLLREKIAEREQAEEALQAAQAELETRVQRRTVELRESNERLRAEMAERECAEEARRKLETQLEHARRMESLGVLVGGIAHGYNNLLAVILGNIELALAELNEQSPARGRIEDVRGAAVRAADLTRQMMAVSGEGSTVSEEIRLNPLIEETASTLRGSSLPNVCLDLRLTADLPPMRGDPAQIRQVVKNLITNASEAMDGPGGVIAVRTAIIPKTTEPETASPRDEVRRAGDCLVLEVSDTGCGMAPDIRQRIFDPFYTTKFTGRGLGLAAVLGIVRAHGGDIEVESEVGKGTTFRVLFPVDSVEWPDEEKKSQVPAEKGNGRGTFLVVDDEELVRSLVKTRLEREGFKVLLAHDGEAGVRIFREHADRIVGVLMDLRMPRMNGEEAFREMRRIRPDVRVILATGCDAKDADLHLRDEGVKGILRKPFRLDRLMEEVSRVAWCSSRLDPPMPP